MFALSLSPGLVDWLTMVLLRRSSSLLLLLCMVLLVLLPCVTHAHGFMPMDGLKKIIKHINQREAQQKAEQEPREEQLHNRDQEEGAGTPPKNMQGKCALLYSKPFANKSLIDQFKTAPSQIMLRIIWILFGKGILLLKTQITHNKKRAESFWKCFFFA